MSVRHSGEVRILQMQSRDGMNRLTRARVTALIDALDNMTTDPGPLIITGNQKFFSVGADLGEIAMLTSSAAYEFSRLGAAAHECGCVLPGAGLRGNMWLLHGWGA